MMEVISTQHQVGQDPYRRVTGFVMEEKPQYGTVNYKVLNSKNAPTIMIKGLTVTKVNRAINISGQSEVESFYDRDIYRVSRNVVVFFVLCISRLPRQLG